MNNITTPQRPQPKNRRTRLTTISGENAMMTPKPQSYSSMLRPQHQSQSQRRTPQQQHQAMKLQRQHSVSCCTPPTGKLSPSQFVRFQKATGGSQASLFAGSKFMDSPAPESIPMPPINWFLTTDLSATPSRARTSPTPSSVSDSLSSASSFEDSKSTSSDELLGSFEHRGGFRVTPMQLIAAVSALV